MTRNGVSQLFTITLLLGAVLLVASAYALTHPLHDFIEYWTAAHLLRQHGNPYALNEMFRAQQVLRWKESVPLMFLSPPWALVFIAPLGVIRSYAAAWLGWVGILAGIVALSSRLLMNVYFGELRISEISDTAFYRCLFAFTFYPVLLCFKFAQTAPLMLLGLAGFLTFEKNDRPSLAGAALSLTLIKPQLLYLVWVVLIFRSFQQRRWRAIMSAFAFTALLTSISLLLDYRAISEYWELARGPYAQVIPSGITAGIRKLLGGRAFWIQLIPPCIGLIWLVWYWRQHRMNWSWVERMPTLVTVSVLTSAYGWIFDQTLLVLPVIALAANAGHESGKLPSNAVIIYTILNCILMLVMGFPPLAFVPAPIFIAVLLWRGRERTQVAALPAMAE